jgi:hypothetical protein
MNTERHERYSPAALSHLHEQARRRARALRREAIDDFWRGANAAWSTGLTTARRSAQRLAHSLARHARLRQEPRSGLEG